MHLFREIRQMRDEGKLHRSLIIRTRILLAISVILSGIVAVIAGKLLAALDSVRDPRATATA